MDLSSVIQVVSYTARAVSSYITGNRSRKLKRELEEKRVIRKKENNTIAHGRALEIQNKNFNNEIGKINYSTTQIWNERHTWLNTVAPNAKEPVVIFDTTIRNSNTKQEEHFAFNPMESLCHSFKKQINEFSAENVYITNVSKEFKSQSAVEAFYNDELPNVAAAIIYGSFDGNFLHINAVYGGMVIEQYSFDEQIVPRIIEKNPYDICLSEIPVSIISNAIESIKTKSEQLLMKEKIQKNLIDLIANTALQALIDSHFSLYSPYYEPLAGLKSVVEKSNELGIMNQDMLTAIETHKKNVIEQRDRIQSLRIDHQNGFIKKFI